MHTLNMDEPNNSMLNERSQMQKTHTLYDSSYMKFPEKANLYSQNTDQSFLVLGVGMDFIANWHEGIFLR